ncbi:MAG: hypothetical protein KatS3mg061_1697 [Dehalococcoidia bacterium]|nr:MAG: hypothetical protein KatS3mg061_1697 [Dehalococcoidia bacterium]
MTLGLSLPRAAPAPVAPRRLLAGLLALALAWAANTRFLRPPPDLPAAAVSFGVALLLLRYALPATGPDPWENSGRWPALQRAWRSALGFLVASGFIVARVGPLRPGGRPEPRLAALPRCGWGRAGGDTAAPPR